MPFKDDIKEIAEKYEFWVLIKGMTDKQIFRYISEFFDDLTLPYDELCEVVDFSTIGVTEEDQRKLYDILQTHLKNQA
jgi:hypothetical protein